MTVAGSVLLAVGMLASTEGSARRDLSYYHYLLSRQALVNHEFSEALTQMEAARDADPKSAELAMELARLHLDIGDPAKAADAARRAAELEPVTSAPRRLLAEALLTAALRDGAGPEDFEAARKAIDDLGRMEPADPEVPLDQARLLLSRGKLEEALVPIGRHLELKPGSEEGAVMGAQVLLKLGRPDQARDILNEAIRVNPLRPSLRVAMVECLEAQGSLQEAAAAASRLVDSGFEPARMRYTLARLKQKMGDHVGAYEELSRLTALMEDHPEEFPPAETAEVRLRALGALAASGRFSSAASEAAEGARKYPDDERFLVRQGEALILLGKDKEAESIYRGKPDATARLSQAYLAAGARREQEKDTAHAERLLRRAIAIEPTNATALNYLGYMMADQGRNLPEAITLIQRAIAREPDNGAYLDSLGWAHFRKGDMPNARKELERARDASPDEAEIHEHLGELYEAMGLTTEALASWQKAIDLGSDHAARIRERMAETGRKPAGKE